MILDETRIKELQTEMLETHIKTSKRNLEFCLKAAADAKPGQVAQMSYGKTHFDFEVEIIVKVTKLVE